jgi:hypothetical protein
MKGLQFGINIRQGKQERSVVNESCVIQQCASAAVVIQRQSGLQEDK